jgi:type I restriction enzyme S subunit
MNLQAIPDSWAATNLGSIVDYGKTQKCEWSDINGATWVVELEDIEKDTSRIISRGYTPARDFKSSKNKFNKGDILYGKLRPYLNKVVMADENGVCSAEIIPINAEPLVSNKYIFYWLKSHYFLDYVNDVSYGVNMPRLGTNDGLNAPFILAPLAEQKEIADRLDTLLAQVEATQTHLAHIPDIIKRFRQSVLAAAVSGELTEDWQESASLWQKLTIDNLAKVKGGKRLPQGEELVEHDTGFPYIRAGQLKQGTVISNIDARTKQLYLTANAHAQISRYIVEEGDVYLTIVGASIGDAGLIPAHYNGANLTENAAKITEFKKPLSSKFLTYWLRSPVLQDLIQLEIKSGAQGKLALKRIKELPVPYPELEEQTEIVRRVEQLFAYADTIEQQAKEAKERVDNLTQAILAKAFRGELTANWRAANPDLISGDNSVTTLLTHIKDERGSRKKNREKR